MKDKNQKTWAIIGGGMMGMTLALRLSQEGYKVTIFESADKPGGLASSWNMGGITWDRFYHVILMSDFYTRKIIKEIGLEDEFKWVETKTGFYSDGKLYSMSNLIEFFKFPPINLIDKFRLGLTIYVASKIRNWKRLENQHVESWLRKWSGKRVFIKIWLPLLKAKLGDNYQQTSAAFIWSTIQRMYAARKSGLKKEMFGYVKGGYDRINKKFAEHLMKMGVDFRLNSKISEISQGDHEQISVVNQSNQRETFNYVISTLSSKQSVEITPQLNEEEKTRHNNIKYLGVICPSVLLKNPISPYYVTNITDTWPPFTGVIEMTALIDKEEVQGKNLIYLPKYVVPEHPLFEKDDDTIKEEFMGSLLKMYDHISESDVDFWGISRARIVFALPTLGYSEKLPGVKTSIENYFIINSAQIINGTLNVNETVKIAESKLKEIISD